MRIIASLRRFILLGGLHFALLPTAFSMDSTEPLPARIVSPAFRYGVISGIDSKYNSSGGVDSLSDLNTIHFDSEQLKRLNPDIESLVTILNQSSGSQHLGDQLNLGTMRINTEPSIRYFVPIYARGITDNWSVGVAMPVIFYSNHLELVQSNSNAAQICDQAVGPGSPDDLKNACNQLRSTKVTDEVRKELAKRGYKPLEDRKETLLGDLQLVSFWRFLERGRQSIVFRNTITLPTGKPKNPDDLADLGSFGQTAIEPGLLYNYMPWKSLRLAAKGSYKLTLPDHVDARVPLNEQDVLPAQNTKERVSRNLGDTITLGTAATWYFHRDFALAGGYEYVQKGADHFSGDRGSRYDLLSRDSSNDAHKLRASLTYDTVALYRQTKKVPPMRIEFEVSNTVAGRNTDRQLVNELGVTLFF